MLKVKRIKLDFDEAFTSEYNKENHYDKHVTKNKEFKNISPAEYEKMADNLAMTPVDDRKILGYKSIQRTDKGEKVLYNKYDMDKELFVVYRPRKGIPEIVTFFSRTYRDYQDNKWISKNGEYEYYDEIPKGE